MKWTLPLFLAALIGSVQGCKPSSSDITVEQPPQAWLECVRQLESIGGVDGDAVGYDGGPGKFFVLSRRIVSVGNEASFRELLKDRRPTTRCMGLLALARTLGVKAVPVIKAQLSDRGAIMYGPGGCTYWRTTAGAFAYALLLNANRGHGQC